MIKLAPYDGFTMESPGELYIISKFRKVNLDPINRSMDLEKPILELYFSPPKVSTTTCFTFFQTPTGPNPS